MDIINKTVYKNKWFEIVNKKYTKENKTYYIFNIPNSSVILPVTKDNEFIIVKQFRESLDDFSLELPAGFIDENETPLISAKRELLEETGYHSNEFEYLGKGRLMMNRTKSLQHLFVAKNVIKTSNPANGIDVIKIPPKKLYNLISSDDFIQLSGCGLILKYLINNNQI